MAWLAMSLRRLREDRLPALGLVVLVLATAFVFAAAPRLLGRVADDALRGEVAGSSSETRNIQLVQERRIPATGGDPLGAVDAAGADLQAQIPARVRSLVVDRVYTVETPRWQIRSETRVPSLVTLRIQQGVADRIRIVAGRGPTGAIQPVVAPEGAPLPAGQGPAYEVALSTVTAADFGVGLGDVMRLALDSTDPLARGHNDMMSVEVVGLFERIDPTAPYWSDDTTLDQPTRRALTADLVLENGVALLAPDAYPAFMTATDERGLPLRYSWRYYLDPGRLDASRVDDVLVDLRRMESVFPASGGAVGAAQRTILRSGLLKFIEAQQGRWRSAQAVLTAVAIGPAAVAGAALGLVILLGSGRRRASLALSRARGASPAQVVGATVVEGLLLTLPAALLAIALAVQAIPGGLDPPTVAIPLAVGAVTILLLVTTILAIARGAPVGTSRGRGEGRRSGPRRLALEALAAGLAIGGAILLRDRGIQGASSTGPLAAADPLIAAVPALAGLAAGLIALRFFPIPIRGLAILAALRRDLVPVLAMRRTTRAGTAAPILLVLLATASVGAFSIATLTHLERAGDAVAWQDVGAPMRLVEGNGRIRSDLDPAALPGVDVAAGGHEAPLPGAGTNASTVDLLAVDLAAYRTVVAGTPIEPALPAAAPVNPGADPLPAIVSVRGVIDGIAPGDRFELIVAGQRVALKAAAVEEAFPTLPVGGPFVVVDRPALTALLGAASLRTTTVFLRAPDGSLAAIRTRIANDLPGVIVESRAERSALIRTAPVVRALTVGVTAAALAAVAYAALALVAALALTGAARTSEAAHLRTLGVGRRQALGLSVVEHGPTVALAIVAGIVLGLGSFIGLRESLGLGAIMGSSIEVPLEVGLDRLLILVVAIGVVVAAAFGLAAIIQREPAAAAALRRGIE